MTLQAESLAEKPVSDQGTVDFFTNPKQIGTVGLALSFAAAWFGATSTKAIMDGYWKNGLSALWMIAIPSTLTMLLVALFVGKRVQALPYMSQPEAVEHAFGKRGRFFLAWVIIIASTTTVASQLVASRQLLNALLGEWGEPLLLSLYGIVILYSLLGGFFAVAFTDTLQCILMLFALTSLAGFVAWQGWHHAEAFQHAWMHPQNGADAYWTLLPEPAYALVLTAVFALAWMIAPEMWQRMKACRSPQQATKVSFLSMAFIIALCACVAWVGLSSQGVFHALGFTPPAGQANVFLWMTQQLPSTAWQALIIVGFLSAVTSTMDSSMNVASQSLVYDVVQRFIAPRATWKELRWVNYAFLPIQAVIAVLIAFRFNDIIKVLWLSADIYASTMLVPVLAILFSKHPHKQAGQWAMLVGFFCILLTTLKQYTALPLGFLPDYPFSTLYSMALAGVTYLGVWKISPQQSIPPSPQPSPQGEGVDYSKIGGLA
jgi:Na+/proline symporter